MSELSSIIDRPDEAPPVIVHVYGDLHPHEGGPPQVILNLVRAQQQSGAEVRLVVLNADDPEVVASIHSELGALPPLFTVRPKGIRAVWSRPVIATALHGASIVHIHSIWSTPNLYVAHYCLRHHIPYLLSIHGHLRREALAIKWLKKKVGLALGYRAMLEGASVIHALNQSEAEDIQHFGLKAPVRVIPNGIDPTRFNETPSRSILDQHIPALTQSPYLLFLSRIHPPKGARKLAEAFRELSEEYPTLHLVIAGSDFGGIDEVRAVIEKSELSKRVHFPGFLSGLTKDSALAHASAFCLPSDHEGFSVAILEALAWGAPTVISTGCHFPELERARAGWVYGVSAEELTETLKRVIDDQELSSEVAQRGREWVRTHFSWMQIERAYHGAYPLREHRIRDNEVGG